MWQVFVVDGVRMKCIYKNRWMPTVDDMAVVHAVRGKVYKVVNPQGKDVTPYFPYGIET